MSRRIIWSSWKHPLGGGTEWSDPSPSKPGKRSKDHFYDDSHDSGKAPPIRPVLVTAAGVVPVSVYGDMTKAFLFWTGDCNFTLDLDDDAVGYEGAVTRIKNVEGVETLDVMTRYRFRVGVGRVFDERTVLRAVEDAVGAGGAGEPAVTLDDEVKGQVDAVREVLRTKAKYWAVVALPNGSIDYTSTDDRAEYEAAVEAYGETADAVGGVVFTSDNPD